MAATADRDGPTLVTAEFDSPERAREAMVALEWQGIDADDIKLVAPPDVPVPDAQRAAEGRIVRDIARRTIVWGASGAVVGAGIGIAIALIAGLDQPGVALLVAALGGGILGGMIAGFWGGASRLPVNEEALDTYTIDPRAADSVRVEIRARDGGAVAAANAVLRDHDARRVDEHTV
jgi:hypothetical protein